METQPKGIIRVLVVEDSLLMCKILTTILNADPQILVTAIARNGKEAVDLVPHLKPDIITMDMEMPVTDGLEATREIMAYHPTPILILSSSAFKIGMKKVFQAISHGALDVMDKGELDPREGRKSGEALIAKIKSLTSAKVMDRRLMRSQNERLVTDLKKPSGIISNKIVAIVASIGGPQALFKILRQLPEDFPCGIVIVQHITSGFLTGMVDWLDKECRIRVKIGEDSEEIRSGAAYIAPDNFQMRVKEEGRISLANEPANNGHRPSGDVLLESVARTYGRGSIGVILTGMGRDGAMGMKAIKRSQGKTIAQNEKSCAVFGMPHAAIEMNVIDQVLPLERITEEIILMVN